MSSKKISIRFALVAFALLFSQLASAHLSAEGAPAVQEGAPMHSLQGGVGQGSAEIFRIYAFPVAARGIFHKHIRGKSVFHLCVQ